LSPQTPFVGDCDHENVLVVILVVVVIIIVVVVVVVIVVVGINNTEIILTYFLYGRNIRAKDKLRILNDKKGTEIKFVL
jgi:hypothetical protein